MLKDKKQLRQNQFSSFEKIGAPLIDQKYTKENLGLFLKVN